MSPTLAQCAAWLRDERRVEDASDLLVAAVPSVNGVGDVRAPFSAVLNAHFEIGDDVRTRTAIARLVPIAQEPRWSDASPIAELAHAHARLGEPAEADALLEIAFAQATDVDRGMHDRFVTARAIMKALATRSRDDRARWA